MHVFDIEWQSAKFIFQFFCINLIHLLEYGSGQQNYPEQPDAINYIAESLYIDWAIS